VRALIDKCNLDPQLKKQVERAVSRYQPESKAFNSPSGEQPSASANRASTFHKSTSPVRPTRSRRQTPFEQHMRLNQFDYLQASEHAQASLAEQYVGLPFEA
jgi:hypothetical protein